MSDSNSIGLIALQAFLSPSYPVGSYAYSHGLEWAIECGDVHDRASLADWIAGILQFGAGWSDAVLIAQAHRVCALSDRSARTEALRELAELSVALTGTAELQQETLQQGIAFLQVTRAAWGRPALEEFAVAIGSHTSYPVCFAAAVAAHSCPLSTAIDGYLFAALSNWISAAVRLNIIGQTAAQALAAELAPVARTIGEKSRAASLDDLGTCAFLGDIASFCHEQQYSRLFRS